MGLPGRLDAPAPGLVKDRLHRAGEAPLPVAHLIFARAIVGRAIGLCRLHLAMVCGGLLLGLGLEIFRLIVGIEHRFRLLWGGFAYWKQGKILLVK